MAEFDDKLNSILSDPTAMSKIMELAQSLGGSGGHNSAPDQPSAGTGSISGQPPLSDSAGGLDPAVLSQFLPLLQELGSHQNSNARSLLLALRPYLKQERQEKVERALQLARLFHMGKKFLAGWGK